ncbi:hypothetical protein PsalN5692_02841 [Piscirickettsia salmonis]|uniref:GNAT family N-acetyltransferase n=1 Tax=Piscirickettsia salmonis TaxID=1238 RepID=UPI0012B74FBD|nr:GNAT family N-acetyltransferase [Piscirickettsia salmonis]QGP51360.1 hypothetical protein PsalN5692_02841 [Piscirickettsia salmonis]
MIEIVKLNREHNRKGFSCGVKSVDNFLHKFARQQNDNIFSNAVTYCAVDSIAPNEILGFYSLHNMDETLNSVLKKAPKEPVGCLLLGWLGVDKQMQGEGLGKLLMQNALKRFVSYDGLFSALLVDPIKNKPGIINFYKDHMFIPCSDTRYFIARETALKVLELS